MQRICSCKGAVRLPSPQRHSAAAHDQNLKLSKESMASIAARSSAPDLFVRLSDASTGTQSRLTFCAANFHCRERLCITMSSRSFFDSKLRRMATFVPTTHLKNLTAVASLAVANDVAIVEGPKDSKSLSDFIRFCDNGDEGLNLQTATISYGKPFPSSILQPNLQVDLVSAVHIADKDYFAVLQEELRDYDRVLYEMVADKDPRQTNRNPRTRWRPSRRLPSGRKRKFSFFGLIQRAMAFLLKLDFQLECLDYRKENWYHADLDYKTFSTLQLARGESVLSFARDMALVSLRNFTRSAGPLENVDPWRAKLLWVSKALPMPLIGLFVIERVCAPPDAPFNELPEVKALLDLDLSAAIKVFLAKQIATDFTDGATSMVEKSVIIGERNRAAMEELREAFRDGCKRIAIFYGGGHMPDMDRRLREQFGLVPKKVQWQTAWSIRSRRQKEEGQFSHILGTMAKISGWPLDRYETAALVIFSWVLAIDLWFWEVMLNSLNKFSMELVVTGAHLIGKVSHL